MKVGVAFFPLFLAGGEVATDEAEGSAVDEEAYGHRALIACSTTHTRLYNVHRHIPAHN